MLCTLLTTATESPKFQGVQVTFRYAESGAPSMAARTPRRPPPARSPLGHGRRPLADQRLRLDRRSADGRSRRRTPHRHPRRRRHLDRRRPRGLERHPARVQPRLRRRWSPSNAPQRGRTHRAARRGLRDGRIVVRPSAAHVGAWTAPNGTSSPPSTAVTAKIGKPARTLAIGQSMGGLVNAQLARDGGGRHRRRARPVRAGRGRHRPGELPVGRRVHDRPPVAARQDR